MLRAKDMILMLLYGLEMFLGVYVTSLDSSIQLVSLRPKIAVELLTAYTVIIG